MYSQKKDMRVLACTGGIGSGKTYVASVFERLGVPVYYSDVRAKQLYSESESLRVSLVSEFGSGIYEGGLFRKERLAEIVFSDEKALLKLESIVHPAVISDFEEWKSLSFSAFGFSVFESAIILDKPVFSTLPDKVLLVSAPEDIRIERVMKRDNASYEDVRKRMRIQSSDEFRKEKADFFIFADGKTAVLPQILGVLESMKNLR